MAKFLPVGALERAGILRAELIIAALFNIAIFLELVSPTLGLATLGKTTHLSIKSR